MITIDQLVEDFDCDAVFCESEERFPEMVMVSPYDTRTGQWVLGMALITSWDEVLKAKCKKVCRKGDKLASEKLGRKHKNKLLTSTQSQKPGGE